MELKRARTPREVVAQVLDYRTWLSDPVVAEEKALKLERPPGEWDGWDFYVLFGPEEVAGLELSPPIGGCLRSLAMLVVG